jgi:hypothetical protein
MTFFLLKPFVYAGKAFKFVFGKIAYKGETIMKNLIISQLVSALLAMLTPELMKKFVDRLLDFIENFVLGTASDLDDKIVLPICEAIRKTFDVPDNDEPKS